MKKKHKLKIIRGDVRRYIACESPYRFFPYTPSNPMLTFWGSELCL